MSQGDPTFNATLKIGVLIRELRHVAPKQRGDLIDAIRDIRAEADQDEKERAWDRPVTGGSLPWIPWQTSPPGGPVGVMGCQQEAARYGLEFSG